MDEAEALCDRISIMDQGKLIAIGTVDELKHLVEVEHGITNPSMEDVFIALTGRDLRDDDGSDEGSDQEQAA
jgi:ABC-2 type transport system ATP-binding protein